MWSGSVRRSRTTFGKRPSTTEQAARVVHFATAFDHSRARLIWLLSAQTLQHNFVTRHLLQSSWWEAVKFGGSARMTQTTNGKPQSITEYASIADVHSAPSTALISIARGTSMSLSAKNSSNVESPTLTGQTID